MGDLDGALNAARSGSADGFAELYRALARPVAAFLRVRGVPDVEDVTSEVFLAAFAGLGRFDGDMTDFRTWLFTIARRRAVDHYRRAGRRPVTQALEPELDPRSVPSAEQTALAEIGDQRVVALLSTLSPDQRDVLLLRIVADLTVDQVAQVVGKRPGAVKALQRRGLDRLRRTISDEGVTP